MNLKRGFEKCSIYRIDSKFRKSFPYLILLKIFLQNKKFRFKLNKIKYEVEKER